MSRLVTDTMIVAERNLIRLPRAPDLLLAFTVQPVMFVLLFVYVFGGAINTPGYDYVDFLIPGIIVQNIAFGGFVTALHRLLVEQGGLGGGAAPRARGAHHDRPAHLTERELEPVTRAHLLARLGRVTVHVDPPALDRLGPERAGLHQPGRPQPLVHADRGSGRGVRH